MYLGRVVGVGQTHDGYRTLFYRLASQSYPNRLIVRSGDSWSVVAREGFEKQGRENPFVIYPTLIRFPDYAIVGNGDHIKAIADLIQHSRDPYRTLGSVLADLGPEDDGLQTPRIVGVINSLKNMVWIGIVGKQSLEVGVYEPRVGGWYFVATEFREQQHISEEFRPLDLESLPDYVRGQGQGTMATIIVVAGKNGLEEKVRNY